LPNKRQVTDLWKSVRDILQFDQLDPSGSVTNLLNTLSGAVNHLGGMRNALGDAHGRGAVAPEVSEAVAELSLNTASTLATTVIRRYNQLKGSANE
jgi:hypothetical protein